MHERSCWATVLVTCADTIIWQHTVQLTSMRAGSATVGMICLMPRGDSTLNKTDRRANTLTRTAGKGSHGAMSAATHRRKRGSMAMLDRYPASSGGCSVGNASRVSACHESPAAPTRRHGFPRGSGDSSARTLGTCGHRCEAFRSEDAANT